MNKKFRHPQHVYNDIDAEVIVPFLVKIFSPQSVIDVGCGLGTWLGCFKKCGIQQVLGVDGAYHEKELIAQNLLDSEFLECDLEKDLSSIVSSVKKQLGGTTQLFDLCISLEVAEHLKESSSDSFITFLTSLSDYVVFSAAIPYQGGDGHINEQWPEYWVNKFKQRGFKPLDIIRPLFWNNSDVKVWYKQNMILFVKESRVNEIIALVNPVQMPLNVVHPELYLRKTEFSRNRLFLFFKAMILWVLKRCRRV